MELEFGFHASVVEDGWCELGCMEAGTGAGDEADEMAFEFTMRSQRIVVAVQ